MALFTGLQWSRTLPPPPPPPQVDGAECCLTPQPIQPPAFLDKLLEGWEFQALLGLLVKACPDIGPGGASHLSLDLILGTSQA